MLASEGGGKADVASKRGQLTSLNKDLHVEEIERCNLSVCGLFM